ncbi:MAG TPA: DUF4834 domain-containing protein [Candidatus Tidjanibacter gallistercoris]|nr:DUF4834 domain-containing protein [Candidatus Tidjanibacter gallistercoris]
MRAGIGTYILIILVVLILFGLVSIGDVLSVAFYIIMGFLALILIGILVFRYRMNRLRREMEAGGETFRTYTWGSPRTRTQRKKDGEVTVQHTETSSHKVVSSEVGDYVEYEEIREERSESRTE